MNQKTQDDLWQSGRYERKFVAASGSADALILAVRTHPACFVRPYPDRWVNNIYLDTLDYCFYGENLAGITCRKKIRIRWYGKFGHARTPMLEIKRKQGQLGIKQHYPLEDFSMNDPDYELGALFARANLPLALAEELKRLRPTVCNRYSRAYFATTAEPLRLTVDSKIMSSAFPKLPHGHFGEVPDLIELKYPAELSERAARVSGVFPFRLSRNSKYVNAMNVHHRVLPD